MPSQSAANAERSWWSQQGCVVKAALIGGLTLAALFMLGEQLEPEADPRAVAEADSLGAIYGERPTGNASIRGAVRRNVATRATNPRSLDVERCTPPAPDEATRTWTVQCEFYGDNALGGTIRNTGRFALRSANGTITALQIE